MSEPLQVNIVIEILGRPKENIINAMDLLIDRLSKEKGIKILNKKIHDPISVENSNLYTSFTEISLELEGISNFFGVLFAYMPSHIEIVSPENISLSNTFLNEIGNVLVQRLHNYDAITKKVVYEKQMILEKIKEKTEELSKKQKENPTEETPLKKSTKSTKSKKPRKSKKKN